MALARVKTWASEILIASDLNAEFNNILNNPVSLISPLTGAINLAGYATTLDAASVTTVQSTAALAWTFIPGAKSGTPGATGGIQNWAASTWTDNNTAASGTATAWTGHSLQRPTLAATNATVTTTDAATFYIANAPAAGTNETLTRAWAQWIDDGACRYDGNMGGIGFPVVDELRLTLTTALPVTIADVTAAGTIYLTPYSGSHISLYDGAQWITYSTAEISLALTATSGKPYDVFCYSNAGVPTLETTVWTNDTTRATALAYQNGVLVKSGATTRRYVGSFYTSGANITEDSGNKRYLFNYYNRVLRTLTSAAEAAASWTYQTNTFRQANANTANQLDYMNGVAEEMVEATVLTAMTPNTLTSASLGIGINSTTVSSAQLNFADTTAGSNKSAHAYYRGIPAAGRTTLAWLEKATGTTATWYGAGSGMQNGIVGSTRM